MTSVDICLLVDFYGNLLTDRMQSIIEMYYFDDLSLSEIADQTGISRQAVHDTVKRATAQLNEYEDKLGLVKRFNSQKEQVNEAINLINSGSIEQAGELLMTLLD